MVQKMKKYASLLLGLLVMILIGVGCSSDYEEPIMPYSSGDYENGEWTLEEVLSNLEELGFDDIEVVESKTRYVSEESFQVQVEDFSSDSWVTEYKDFEKGEPLYSWRKVKIDVTIPIPVMTVENTPELADSLAMCYGSDDDVAVWEAFMKEHNGEYIEFDGVVTYVYDELWFSGGITLAISFEEYEGIDFEWSCIEPNDIGYNCTIVKRVDTFFKGKYLRTVA